MVDVAGDEDEAEKKNEKNLQFFSPIPELFFIFIFSLQ